MLLSSALYNGPAWALRPVSFSREYENLEKLTQLGSDLSQTSYDANVSIEESGYPAPIASMLKKLLAYGFADALLQACKLLSSCSARPEFGYYALTREIDRGLLDYERRLADSSAALDPFAAEGLENIARRAMAISNKEMVMCVKLDKLRWLLLNNPPRNLMLNYKVATVEELLKIVDIQHAFTLARYTEPFRWGSINNALYETLTPEDFESRPLRIIIFREVPPRAADYFKKKLPFSNDKVAGVLSDYPVPPSWENRVPRVRALSRALHYIREVDFYSEITKFLILNTAKGDRPFGKTFADVLSDNISEDQFLNRMH